MKTFSPDGGKKECRSCRRGMIIVTALFFLAVVVAAFLLIALYNSIG